MTRKYFSGNTLDQAVMMAARHYELEPNELAYRQLEKKHGFLRTRKSVMIVVDPENPRRGSVADGEAAGEPREDRRAAPPEPEHRRVPEPEEPDEERPEEDDEDDEEEVWAADEPDEDDESYEDDEDEEPAGPDESPRRGGRHESEPEAAPADRPAYRDAEPRDVAGDDELLDAAEEGSEILLQFAGIDAEATAKAAGERVEVEIEGPDDSVLVVEGGKGLLSIQHLLPRMMRGLTGRSSFVRVDSRQFHQQRKERLEALALKEADAASRDHRPRTLPPMAPDERRIVHLALKDSPTVVTESRGTGLHKRVVIRPADDFNEPGDIEARHGF